MKKRKIALIGLIAIFMLSAYFLLLPSNFSSRMEYSKLIYDRNGELIRIYLNSSEQLILPPESPKEIPTKLKKAAIHFEDKNFYCHKGVDTKAVLRAIYSNLKNKRVVSGASTISMQTIRILRGGRRSYLNKFIEAVYAIQLELRYSKEEILNLYLSHAPYGGNIQGYRAASLRYFNKIPKELTWAEASTLAILPNAPSLLTGIRNRDEFLKKRDRLLLDLYRAGMLSEEDYYLSLAEALPERLYPIPQEALFFTDFVRDSRDSYRINTTLDIELQQRVESIVAYHREELEREAIYNTAVMVVDTKSRDILAYIGGSYRDSKGGRIDALQVRRNSGSTLKPFLYTLAYDRGLISSLSLLEDIPSHFQSFNPVNSDRQYRGLVRADRALELSLNVPMVRLLQDLGHFNFYSFLKEGGVENLKEPDYYGLSMILGTIELSPYELAELYTTLGNLGEARSLNFLLEDDLEEKKRLYSRGASWLTLDILGKVARPTVNWEFFRGRRDFYWKTGTSFGERDAWAVGTNSQYTIVVWNGNLNNSSSSKLRGIDSSAPLLFDILNSIGTERGSIPMPQELYKVELSPNGYRSIYDNNTLEGYLPKDVVLRQDPYERLIYTDLAGKVEVDSRSFQRDSYRMKIINDYPSQVAYFLKMRGIEVDSIERISGNRRAQFIYPKDGLKLKIPRLNTGEYQAIEVEVAEVEGEIYYWYLNNTYIDKSLEPRIFMTFVQGLNTIDVISDKNTYSTVNFWVE